MKVRSVKTHKITVKDNNIFAILDRYLPKISEKSVVAVTSKIVSITEGSVVKIEDADLPAGRQAKDKLIEQESEYYLPRDINKYGVSFAITNGMLAAGAGIDESNGAGYYVLWPRDPQKVANDIRGYLKKRFSLINIGVIITDSKATPLRWGVTGIGIAYSGFRVLNSYIGKPDIFGRKFVFETVNVMDSLAASAVYAMGEGNEQLPLAIISDIPHIVFQKRNPTEKELRVLRIPIEDDLYGPFLQSVRWKKGKKSNII